MFQKIFNKLRLFWQNKISKENLVIPYKLLNDLLFIGLVFLFFMLVGESLLPGIISTRISFSIVIIAILLDILLIKKLANYLGIQKSTEPNKKALIFSAFVFAIFILNSLVNLFRFNILLAIVVFLLVLLTGYSIYKLAFEG